MLPCGASCAAGTVKDGPHLPEQECEPGLLGRREEKERDPAVGSAGGGLP